MERLEDPWELLGADPDPGVLDQEPQTALVWPDLQRDAALGRVLDGVVEQVHEDLTQPFLVRVHRDRQVGRPLAGEGEALFFRARPHEVGQPVQEPRQVKGGGTNLDRSRLDLGQVQDLVDQRQQVLAGALDDAQRLSLLGF